MFWLAFWMIIIFGWAGYGLYALGLHMVPIEAISKPLAKWMREPGNAVRAAVWVGAVALTVTSWFSQAGSFWNEMFTELVGISLTVIVIDELVQYRSALLEKQRIISQMASHSNDFALDAVRQIAENGWLCDGKSLVAGNFKGANLVNAKLQHATLQGANFQDAKLTGTDLSEASLQGADLGNAELKEAKLERTNLQETNLFQTDFQNANLFDAKLQGARLGYTNFQGADLLCADLRDIDMSWAPRIAPKDFFQGANLHSANLQGSQLPGIILHDVCLTGSNLQNTDLFEASFQDANLSGTEFQRANLAQANFANALMTGSNLSYARLMGANLYDAEIRIKHEDYPQLGGITVQGAIYDDDTKWPEGFDAKAAGAIKVKKDKASRSWVPDEN